MSSEQQRLAKRERARDKVGRDFTVRRPNQLWVSGLTDFTSWTGFSCVAFVVDVHVYAGMNKLPSDHD